ncbi:hypothetical protein BDW62DRAFT_198652 [Aspergillus aurantiobrunneus]
MGDHYHYPDYNHFPVPDHLPIAPEVQFYPHPDANTLVASMPDTMMGCASMVPEDAIKSPHFPPFDPLRYPPPPSASDMGYWAPTSPFDESVRSVSPQTDCQSSGYMPSLIDDTMSSSSGFESSPSPPYHESFYHESMGSPIEPVHTMPQQASPVFLPVSTTHQPSNYTTSPTSSPSEPAKSPNKAPSTREASTRKRIQKRTGKSRGKKTPAQSSRAEQATASKEAPKKATDRRFECCFARYGCASTFPSKNEWKRHVSSQHIQLGFYRCDVGRCSLNNLKHRSPSPHHDNHTQLPTPASSDVQHPSTPTLLVNDFNRKDLFIQHQRRMHAPWITTSKTRKQSVSQTEKDDFEASLEDVWKRCWRQLRVPPTLSRCGFCAMEFRGANAWKERMEHVAMHFEKADPGPEEEDVPLREWAEENGVIRPVFSLIIINKAGGLIYQREFHPGLRKLSTNDYLVLAGTFHGVHAITRSITPKIPNPSSSTTPSTSTPQPPPSSSGTTNSTAGTPSTPTQTPTGTSSLPPSNSASTSNSTYPNPNIPISGLETLETDKFRLTCFQTLTGTKFLLFTDPLMDDIDVVMKGIYELYADYVMKNPFYQIEMPVRCERFERGVGGYLRARG